MFTIMPTPAFAFGGDCSLSSPLSKYRPAVSSPLSSSPIRASSPPLSPLRDTNSFRRRDTQSSPIQAPPTKFKFATRTPRPNPVVQKREDTQESRRRLFLKNVRDRADDKTWERRGGDQELLKLEWWRLNREWRQAKDAELAEFGNDADIEEAVQLQQNTNQHPFDEDEVMVDALAQEEEAEIEALLPLMPITSPSSSRRDTRPESLHFSDDDAYDDLFMDFISRQRTKDDSTYPQDMDMS